LSPLEFYESNIEAYVDEFLNGFNATIFAYGHTGAGKSYTILGNTKAYSESNGVLFLAMKQILSILSK